MVDLPHAFLAIRSSAADVQAKSDPKSAQLLAKVPGCPGDGQMEVLGDGGDWYTRPGKLTVCYRKLSFIVDFPIKNCDFNDFL